MLIIEICAGVAVLAGGLLTYRKVSTEKFTEAEVLELLAGCVPGMLSSGISYSTIGIMEELGIPVKFKRTVAAYMFALLGEGKCRTFLKNDTVYFQGPEEE